MKFPSKIYCFGLRFSDLEWEEPFVSNNTICKNQSIEISVNIKNNSTMDVEEIIEVYLSLKNSKEAVPFASLLDYTRVSVNSNEHTFIN
ncbi:MAG: hypothetical protein R3250_10850 [Melioribacteraceae bacterium]|nr:hypothetical protein [Melioribacteraceae bacterium]